MALAYRLDAISQGPKNYRIPGPNPLLLPQKWICTHPKYYARGCINHRCKNSYSSNAYTVCTERSKTERGRESPVLATLIFRLEGEDLGMSLLLRPGQDVQARKLKCSFLVMAYSALLNNVFDALNLLLIIFYTYVAEIQLPGSGIWAPLKNTEFWLEFCHGWPLVVSITLCKVLMLYVSSLC